MIHLRLFVRAALATMCIIAVIGMVIPTSANGCVTGITVTSADSSATEQSASVIFTFTADGPSDCAIEIPYTLTDVTTTSGVDYGTPIPASPLILPIGDVTTTLEIPFLDDDIDELDETFTIEIGSVLNATFNGTHPVGEILDDDTASLSVDDVTVTEGESGTTNAIFTVALDHATSFDVTVDVTTGDDSAVSGVDFTPVSETVVFTAGQTSLTVTVEVTGDSDGEAHEQFFLNLASVVPPGVILSDAQAIGTINNDDAPVSIDDVSINEGDSGITCATFTATIPFISVLTASVEYGTSDITDEAGAGSDYTAKTGTLTFNPGETSQTVCIDVSGDDIYEDDETFALTLSSPTNATLVDADGIGTIINDDLLPTVNITAQSVTEGSGDINTLQLVATLDGRTEDTVTVTLDTADDTATDADYSGLTAQILTIFPEQTSGSLPVSIITDFFDEPDETFTATLSSPVNAAAGDLGPAVITILDDDLPPIVSISDATCNESAASCLFTISLDSTKPYPVTVDYVLTSGTATAEVDFSGLSGTFSVPADQLSADLGISVGTFDDAIYEDTETFTITLQPTSGLVLGDADATGYILDDDDQPTLFLTGTTVTEGDSGTTDAVVTFSLNTVSSLPVTVDFTTENGTAVAGSDYTSHSGQFIIPAGQVIHTETFTVLTDILAEPTESFGVRVTSILNGITDGTNPATVTITDEDPLRLSVADQICTEGNPPTTLTCVFTITSDVPTLEDVVIDYSWADVTSEADDFDHTGGSVTLLMGETNVPVNVNITPDLNYEFDDTFNLILAAPINAIVSDGITLGTILNDDAQPVLNLSGEAKAEGSAGANTFTATFTLTGQTNLPVTFEYATTDGSAKATAGDYTTVSGSHTLTPGQTSFSFPVTVNGDTLFERDEAFNVEITSLTNAASTIPMTPMTLQNDDAEPLVSVDDTSCAENAVSCIVTITIDAVSGVDVRVDYATSDVSAIAGDDYTTTSGTFIIPMGHLGGTVHVTVGIWDNLAYEGDETFTFTLSNPVDATLGTAIATAMILENDPQPTLIVTGDSKDEGNTGTTSVSVTFNLSAAAELPVTVDFTTEDNTAVSPSDYTARSGQFVIPAGQVIHTETFEIFADSVAEYDETFGVRVTGVVNAVPDASNPATVTIENDDGVNISVSDCIASEGESCVFVISVDVPALEDIDIDYSLSDLTSEADDFNHIGGTVTLPLGDTSVNVLVDTTADAHYEFDDTFSITLAPPSNTVLLDGVGVGTITNDDARPSLTATTTALSLNEGASGLTDFVYPLTLSAKSDETITVTAISSDDTATVADSDYAALNTTITFAPGITSQNVVVNVIGDTKQESDEGFSVALSEAVNATLDAGSEVLTATILNDDGQPVVSISDVTQAEGTGTTTDFGFIVSLSNPSINVITVEVITESNGQADGDDYVTLAPTLVTFAAGTTTQTVTVTVTADLTYEDDETFLVELSTPVNASLGDGVAVGLISNDDAVPTLSLNDQSFSEGSAGANTVNLTVSLSNPSENPVDFTLDTADGTAATADSDYTAIVAGGYTVPVGQTSVVVAVTVNGDSKHETDETFSATVSAVSNAQNGAVTATYTLTNDDAVPTLSAIARTCNETDADTTCAVTFSLSNPSYLSVTASADTSDGTGNAPADYTAWIGESVSIMAGDTQTTLPITIVGDDIYEQAQIFSLTLSGLSHADAGTLSAIITIEDDDDAPILSFQNTTVAVNEGDSGITELIFTLSQSAASEVTTSFSLGLADGTAQIATDYNALASTSGSIPAGSTSTTVTVALIGDTDYEPNETFILDVTGITNATPASLSATGELLNDDLQPFITVSAAPVIERDLGQTSTCAVTVGLSNRSTQTVSVTVVSQNGTATSGGLYPDYTPFVQFVEFPPLTDTPVVLNFEILGDVLYEGSTPETVLVVLGGEDNARGVQTDVACHITENDVPPTVRITGSSVIEGNTAGQNTMPVALTLSGPSAETITAFISTSDGTNSSPATAADEDYVALSGFAVVFDPLETEKQTGVSITGDTVYEMDETFIVNIDSATQATVSSTENTADFIILNDEPLPTLTLVPLSSPIVEGTNSGFDRRAAYLVSLDIESALPVTFTWEIFGGTASAGGLVPDYSPASETGLTIAPGVTSLVIGPLINQDTMYELSETLSLRVVGVSGATPSPSVPQGTISITDDDSVPSLSVSPVFITEGDSGKQALRFALSNPTYQTVTFTAITTNGTATTADNDYTAITGLNPSTNLPFEITPANSGLDVALVTGDTIVEANETFTVTITAAGNVTVPTSAFSVTIGNDDALPVISAGVVSVTEGAASSTAIVTVPVTLNRPSDAVVSASLCATDGTATTAGNDYVQECKTVTFPVRDTSESVTFTVNGDGIYEKLSGGTVDPHFVVTVTSPVNGTAGTPVNITIIDDDPIPTLTLTAPTLTVTEGTGGTPNTVQFQVNLSNPTEQAVSLTYSTFDTSTEGAADYTSLSNVMLTVPANSVSATINVSIVPDDVDEPNEIFGVRITTVTNATATLPLNASTEITDDDDAPIISITGDSELEGDALTVGFTLSRQSESVVTVLVNTADGTAASGSDYTAVINQTVTFAAGTTSQTLTVTTLEDTLREPDETFTIGMSSPSNATLNVTSSATLTIRNEDMTVMLELVTNPSFEGKILTPWKAGKVYNNADKIVCGTTPGVKSFDGLCSFQFTGNTGPKAQVQGIFDKAAIEAALGAAANDVGTEDVIRITFVYRAPSVNNKPWLRVQAFLSTQMKPKLLDQALPLISNWGTYTVDVPLNTLNFTSLRVLFIDKSLKGKWFLDKISILYIDNAPTTREGEAVPRDGAIVLPLPAAPDGFRK